MAYFFKQKIFGLVFVPEEKRSISQGITVFSYAQD